MSDIDEIMRRSREARERIAKAGQQYAVQKKQLAKADAYLAVQEAQAVALREQAETARLGRERRLQDLPPATNDIRRALFKIMVDYDVHWKEIVSHSRRKNLDAPRREVYVYMRSLGWSYPKIGAFCNRDHASIINGVQKYNAEKELTNE
jgi:hypothetical protein